MFRARAELQALDVIVECDLQNTAEATLDIPDAGSEPYPPKADSNPPLFKLIGINRLWAHRLAVGYDVKEERKSSDLLRVVSHV